jgi:biopolymer transport protein ExbB/TolQ
LRRAAFVSILFLFAASAFGQDSRAAALADLRAKRAEAAAAFDATRAALNAEIARLRAEIVEAVEAARAAESETFRLAAELETEEYFVAKAERDADVAEAELAAAEESAAPHRDVLQRSDAAEGASPPSIARLLVSARDEAERRARAATSARLVDGAVVVGGFQTFVAGPGGVYGKSGPDGALGGPYAVDGFDALVATLREGGRPAWFPLDPTGIFRAPRATGLRAWFQSGGPVMFGIALLAIVGFVVAVHRGASLLTTRADADTSRARAAAWLSEWRAREENLDAETLLDRAVSRAEDGFHRGRSTIASIAAVAPLVGLLGTVTGMIKTFDALALSSGGDASGLSGGIAEALITTEAGLCVAIPALLAHAALGARARKLVDATLDAAEALVAKGAEAS